MTFSRKVTSLAAAAAVATGALIPLATAAEAGKRHGHHYGRHYDGGHSHRYAEPYHYGYGYGYRKRKRNNVGKAIAIGAGLLMLGIIASEAHRGRRHRY